MSATFYTKKNATINSEYTLAHWETGTERFTLAQQDL